MNCKMIIVEDEKFIRDGLMKFEWHNIRVEAVDAFDNGISALEFLRENAIDIVLTDIKMPVIDGIEFIKCIRKEFPEIFIVCLSGYCDYAYLRECMQQGVKDYILKPTDEKELFEVISRLVDEKLLESKETGAGSAYLQKCVIEKAMEYIDENYQRPIKLVDIAKNLALNHVYFSYVFKKQTGVGFVDYLTDYRIQKAIVLLQNPELTISAVATLVGFQNARYFAETFKKRKGMTPSEYRKKQGL